MRVMNPKFCRVTIRVTQNENPLRFRPCGLHHAFQPLEASAVQERRQHDQAITRRSRNAKERLIGSQITAGTTGRAAELRFEQARRHRHGDCYLN
jgi:hypothetical protein